jgi:hypothetical protein
MGCTWNTLMSIKSVFPFNFFAPFLWENWEYFLWEIENIIRSLKAKGFHGYDEITTKILKISAPFISTPLSYIFNKCMISGIFPTRLKYATMKPIFKNGDKKNVANYRPISILPSFLKILEKIMYV